MANENSTLPQSEYAARRRKLLASLRKSLGLVFAGEGGGDHFRPHPHFEYLTGITDEPGAVLVLDPTHPVVSRRERLFLRPLNPEEDRWEGYRMEISQPLRERTGFEAVFRLNLLPRFVTESAARCKSLSCLHPLAQYNQPVSPDLDIFQKIAQRAPGMVIEDRSHLLAQMRAVKSKREVAMIQRAIDITAAGFDAGLKAIRPGMNEFQVQETIERAYRDRGSRRTSFSTIVGSGINSTVLHYGANDKTIEDGDLIVIDSGAVWNGYAADITRTVPANGRFTKRQREVYDIVLRAMEAAIKAVKPGAHLMRIDKVARDIIKKAGYGDCFIHGTGHHLGLETHDITPDEPLRAGAVITIEPGIYIPDERIGIRIEDDVLVTSTGSKVLSAMIPKKADAIERLMTDRRGE
jgi:Xaa-Pro aminopeptidase